MRPLFRVLRLWRAQAPFLLLGALIALAALACAAGLMLLSGALIASALGGVLLAVPLLIRVLGPARVVLRYLERLVAHGAMFRALAGLRVWFFRGLARGAAGGLGFQRAGDVLSRLVHDVEALDGVYLRILIPMAGAVLLLPVLLLFIGRHAPHVAVVVGLLFVCAAFVLPWHAARTALAAGGDLARAGAALRVAAVDAMAGLREIRVFGAEDRVRTELADREAALLVTQRDLSHRASRMGALSFLCGQGAILCVLASAAHRPAFATAALFLLVAAFEAVGGMPRAGVLAGHAAAAARRVLGAAEQPPLRAEPTVPTPMPAGNTLRFEDVVFRWQDDRAPVFEGLDLEIQAGSNVAIIGPSGAGKSTLAALALLVAAPQAGRVTLGGTDLAGLPAAAVRDRIAWLGQATHLFDDSIRANLLLGRPDATEADLWAALDAAEIGALVRGLPDGLDSWVGENGTLFSGGQGRRLALARVLLSAAPVLILDEPCAGLDADTERAFLATLYANSAERTTILIVHRLTGAERLDRIWRISAGTAMAATA